MGVTYLRWMGRVFVCCRPPLHRLYWWTLGACRGRSSKAQPVGDGRHFLPFGVRSRPGLASKR